jgi:hypothetical protein
LVTVRRSALINSLINIVPAIRGHGVSDAVSSCCGRFVAFDAERRPEAANPECHRAWEFTRAIDSVMAAGRDLLDQLAAGGDVDPAALERVARMAEQVQEAQRRTVNGLNFAMARDVGRAYALIHLARAASEGTLPTRAPLLHGPGTLRDV